MNVLAAHLQHREVTEAIIGCAYRVYNTLGYGFLESVYQKALLIELQKAGLRAEAGTALEVIYEGQVVGVFETDVMVEGTVLLELKSVRTLTTAHEAQLVNYLTATGVELGLLINFGERGVEVKRKLRTLKVSPQSAPSNPE